jgi:pimeloyl-ACP methyl ester carboxylesterase
LILASLPAGRNHAGAFSDSAEAMAQVLEEEGGEAAGGRFVWGPDSGLDDRGAALIRQGFLEHDPIGLARVLRGALPELVDEIDAPRLEGELKIPTLLIAGGRDPGSLASTRRLAARLPHAQSVILEEAGHVVNLVAPAAFNEAMGAFLDALQDE